MATVSLRQLYYYGNCITSRTHSMMSSSECLLRVTLKRNNMCGIQVVNRSHYTLQGNTIVLYVLHKQCNGNAIYVCHISYIVYL